MLDDKSGILADCGRLVDALQLAGAVIRGKNIGCPFHDDRHPSGAVYQHRDSHAWRFKCHGCNWDGDIFDVLAKHQGRDVGEVLKEMTANSRPSYDPKKQTSKPAVVYPTLEALQAAVAEHTRANLEEVYLNRNPQTDAVEMIILRLRDGGGKKTIRQASPVPGGFVLKAPAQPWPLFGRYAVAKKNPPFVVVVEGENKCKALADAGVVGVCSHGGALKAHHTDWTPLAGVAIVYLWPDHDAPDPETKKRTGHEHMKQVADLLATLEPAPRVMWIDPDTLGLDEDGSDVVDYLAEFGGDTKESKVAAIKCALSLATPIGGSTDLADYLEDAIAGRRRTLAFPWPHLTRLTCALMPGTVTAVCGDPGSGKSLWIMETFCWWHQQGVKVAVFMLEEDRVYHLSRALAQLEEEAGLANSEWTRMNPDRTRAALAARRELLDSFAPRIDAAPDAPPNHATLLTWIKQRAKAGCRIIAIDPITAAATSDKPWLDDLNFLTAAKQIMREYGASLILTTHPRKGYKRGAGLDDLAGGAAYPRFAQTVFWIVRHEKPKKVKVSSACGIFTTTCNRSIRIGKTRNGAGAGMELAYQFDPQSLRFSEQGVIAGDGDEDTEDLIEDAARINPVFERPVVLTDADRKTLDDELCRRWPQKFSAADLAFWFGQLKTFPLADIIVGLTRLKNTTKCVPKVPHILGLLHAGVRDV